MAVGADSLRHLVPVHVTMGRLAATVRVTVTVVAVASAVLGAVAPVSASWLAGALVVLVAWTGCYGYIAWNRGVRPWLAAVDLSLGAGLCLALGRLVPEAALPRGSSWVAVVVSMMIIWAQPAGSPWIWVPAGIAVAASFVAGSRLAHVDDGGLLHGMILAMQAVGGAAVMRVAVRAGRDAARMFDGLQADQMSAAVAAARQADELVQLRLLHNGPLTTLTMAIHSDTGRPSALLRRRAAANLMELPRLAQDEAQPDAPLRLDEQLAQVVVWYDSALRITARFAPCLVDAPVAAAFMDAVSESLENVVRHAGTDRSTVELDERAGRVLVTVTDRGRGFEPDAVPEHRFGLRHSVLGRMAAVGGTATVTSAPGRGTGIELAWRRGG